MRILDFAHAREYLCAIAELVRGAGTHLPSDWLELQCHDLKHHGPKGVLKEVGLLLEKHPGVPELETKVKYLRKREQQMQYPLYQQLGWPLGSGSVESANKSVVQARLKGAGMPCQVCTSLFCKGVAPPGMGWSGVTSIFRFRNTSGKRN
jgi:hypothetical protein